MSKKLENRVPPPVVAVLVAALMIGAGRSLEAVTLPVPLRVGVAGLLALVAAVFGLSAFSSFTRAKTTINPVNIQAASALVTSGIYRFSRNPMYVALTALLACLAVAWARPWLLFGPLLFVLFTTRFQVIPEERVLQAKFGDAYSAYRARVRRWL